jgi:hypothetical protein
LYFRPTAITSDWDSRQAKEWHWEKATKVPSTTGSGMTRSMTGSLDWKLTDQLTYKFSQSRDLMQRKWQGDPKTPDGWLIHRLGLGSEVHREQTFEYNATLNWLKLVRPEFHYLTTYNETHSIVVVSGRNDSVNTMTVTSNNELRTGTSVPLGSWLAKITALRNERKDTSAEAGSPRWLVIQIDKILRGWDGVNLSFIQTKGGSADGLIRRPTLLYQLGWIRTPKGIERLAQNNNDNPSMGNEYTADSRFQVGPVSVTGNWGRRDNWTTSGAITTYNQANTWPSLQANISSVNRVWPQAMSSATLATSYFVTRERQWQQERGLSSDARRISFTPLVDWGCTWKPGFRTTVKLDRTIEDTKTLVLNDWRRDYTVSNTLTGSLSYSFTAQKGLSFNLGKLGKRRFRFSNELTTSLSGSYGQRKQIQLMNASQALSDARVGVDQTNLTISTQATYRFTNSINGTMSANYGSVTNKINSVSNSRTYGLDMFVNVTF